MNKILKTMIPVSILMLILTMPTFAYQGVAVQTNGVFFEAMEDSVLVYVGTFGGGIGTRIPSGYEGMDWIGTVGIINDGLAIQGLAAYPLSVEGYDLEARGGVELDLTNSELKLVLGIGYVF